MNFPPLPFFLFPVFSSFFCLILCSLSALLQLQLIPHKQTTESVCEVQRLLLLPYFSAKAIILSSPTSSPPLPFSVTPLILSSPPHDPFFLQLFGSVLMTSVSSLKDAKEGVRSGWVALPLGSSVTIETSTVVFTLNIQFSAHILQLLQSYMAVVDFYFYGAVK